MTSDSKRMMRRTYQRAAAQGKCNSFDFAFCEAYKSAKDSRRLASHRESAAARIMKKGLRPGTPH
jgi:hypothetical protein